MILKILIKNLILIDVAEIEFNKGLNIITGESGSGKSALLSALGLIIGRKCTPDCIRQGCEIAFVEALFDLTHHEEAKEFLKIEGFDFTNSLTLRREISKNGKTRCFISDELCNLSTLRSLGSMLLQMADQNSHEDLNAESTQRRLLDLFAKNLGRVQAFSKSYDKEKELSLHLQNLLSSESKNEMERQRMEEELQEIQTVNLQPNEDQRLSEEHHLLTHAQDILEKINLVHEGLNEDPFPILSKLGQFVQFLKPIVDNHDRFKDAFELIKNAKIELDEASRLLHICKDSFEVHPDKIITIEQRLKTIETLKKKYGADFEKINNRKTSLEASLKALDTNQEEKEEIQKALNELIAKNNALCHEIHAIRKEAAANLQISILNELKSLNLSNSFFQITLEKTNRTKEGEDAITFLFSANNGEPLKSLKECASGGELSRLMLATQSVLADQRDAKTLIFDEIDANVGGKTAAMIGEKLHNLGSHRQIICVTHFVQVAKFAHRHLLVKKTEKNGRMSTSIDALDPGSQEKEFNRMIGK